MKPGIIVLSSRDENEFRWLSDGWFEESARNTPEAQELMEKATECIRKAASVEEVICLLREAGFEIS